jgi:hypothetical protein
MGSLFSTAATRLQLQMKQKRDTKQGESEAQLEIVALGQPFEIKQM